MLHRVCVSKFLVRNGIYCLYFNQGYEISCGKGKEGKQGKTEADQVKGISGSYCLSVAGPVPDQVCSDQSHSLPALRELLFIG